MPSDEYRKTVTPNNGDSFIRYARADEAVRRARERLPNGDGQAIEDLAIAIMGEIAAEEQQKANG